MEPPLPSSDPLSSTQASRIYLLPNLMTAGNLFCGFIAIIRCIQARFASMTGEGIPEELYTEAVETVEDEHERHDLALALAVAEVERQDGEDGDPPEGRHDL